MLRLTFELKPPAPVTVTVYFTEPLRFNDCEEGVRLTVKELAGFTTRVAVMLCVSDPDVPLIVKG